jgi:hypothetical protein
MEVVLVLSWKEAEAHHHGQDQDHSMVHDAESSYWDCGTLDQRQQSPLGVAHATTEAVGVEAGREPTEVVGAGDGHELTEAVAGVPKEERSYPSTNTGH